MRSAQTVLRGAQTALRSVQTTLRGAQTTLRGAQTTLRGVQTALRGAQTKKKGSVVISHTGVLPTNLMLTGVNCISVVKRAYMASEYYQALQTGSSRLFFH